MTTLKRAPFFLLIFVILVACERVHPTKNTKGAFIFRKSQENCFLPPINKKAPCLKYPWTSDQTLIAPITLEHFRCKGSATNPLRCIERSGKAPLYLKDCKGDHSLPIREGKEFIYPQLLSLLNYIQQKLDAPLVITTGHRCPLHNRYCDASSYNWGSKHTIGAEVDFYCETATPEKILSLIQEYYESYPVEYREFKRFSNEKLNISTPAWYNHEIFIKLYLKEEGRDQDNQHSFSYLSIQMRYEGEKRVHFSEELAQGYYRSFHLY